jgi:ABC-type uncharacterized transport system ATPase subunit
VDKVLVMKDGQIAHQGTFQQLQSEYPEFSSFVQEVEEEEEEHKKGGKRAPIK